MTLFGGHEPLYDLLTPPDCMSNYVHAELLTDWDPDIAEDQTATPEGAFAWTMLFSNFAVIVPLGLGEFPDP